MGNALKRKKIPMASAPSFILDSVLVRRGRMLMRHQARIKGTQREANEGENTANRRRANGPAAFDVGEG
jgi:hypothetical protein